MRRIATYLRADNPDGPASEPAQRAFFEQWFAENPDAVLVHAFEELGCLVPTSFFMRPGAQALLAAVKAGEIDAILVRSTDRLSRFGEELTVVMGLLLQEGRNLITDQGGELTERWLRGRMEGIFAEYMRMVRSDAARRGAATRKANRLAREAAARKTAC